MNEQDLIEFLKKNMKIEFDRDWDDNLEVTVKIGDVVICTDYTQMNFAPRYHNHDD